MIHWHELAKERVPNESLVMCMIHWHELAKERVPNESLVMCMIQWHKQNDSQMNH